MADRSDQIGLHNLKPKPGTRKPRKRLGRGEGSGLGKQSGRGHKGAGARSGSKRKVAYEGGQNPINLVKATMDGLMRLRRPEQVAELRGLTVRQVLGLDLEQEGAAQTAEGDGAEGDGAAEPVAVAMETDAPAEPAPAEPAPEEPAAPEAPADGGEPS